VGFVACALAACGSGHALPRDGGAGAGGHGDASTSAGAAGATGAAGSGSAAGADMTGAAGATGTAGATGLAGATGTAGATGIAGAGGTGVAGMTGAAGSGTTFSFSQSGINRNVDVVFMVDDSSSMELLQSKLTAAFPAYIDALKALPGGLPNLHIGVVSSSLGAGRDPSIFHCMPGGDQGVFRSNPLGGAPCTRASLNAGQSFIIDVNGQANFTGDISDVFACIALLGAQGCGFEHQLASVARALGADGAPAPAPNANFLRVDALLQIILLTNEDDCSAPPDSDLFDSSSSMVSDPLGPLQSYRCNEFGHLCGGQMPPRQPAGDTDLGMCVSNEMGKLIAVGDFVKAFKALKTDASHVFVSAIAGPPTPYKVNVGPSQVKGDPNMWPYVDHSCTNMEVGGSVTYADPGVRLNQLTYAFGTNGLFQSLCAPDFTSVLRAIAAQVGNAFGPPCLPATLDPTKCSFTDKDPNGTTSTPLRACVNSVDVGPCWSAKANTVACPAGQELVFNRPAPPAAGATTTVTCPP
jgi:hypothetical protein